MAMIYIDGFDSYVSADLPKRWIDTSGANFTIDATAGRNGAGAVKVTSTNTRQLVRSLGANRASVVVGVGFKATSLPPSTASPFLILAETAGVQLELRIDTIGSLLLYSGTTLIATYAAGITAGSWNYFEVKLTVSNSISSGTCVICMNGVAVITPSAGTNMRQGTSNAYVNRVVFGVTNGWGASNVLYWDDFYCLDNSGSINNDLLGDVRVETIRPDANGTTNQWSLTGAASNYLAVNETTAASDTAYVSSGTVSQVDLYGMANLSNTPDSVYGVQLAVTARKDDAGSRSITGAVRSGSTTYDHGSTTTLGLGDSYTTLIDIWETNPNGGVAWTGSTVNAIEAGVKLVS